MPVPLSPGDRVALVAPAGFVKAARLAAEIRYLESLGLKVTTRLPRKPDRYLSGSDTLRADEFLGYWRDPGIKALFAVRGGFGCARIAPLLQSRLGGQAKLFVGFSDNTVIHQVLAGAGTAWSLHGPHPAQFGKPVHPATRRQYEKLLFGKLEPGASLGRVKLLYGPGGRTGKPVQGRLTGGNLAVLASLCGTGCPPRLGGIVFLEDVNEQAYRLDAFLTQLRLSGAFRGVRALVLGDFSPPAGARRYRQSVEELMKSAGAELGVPVWTGFAAGHGRRNLALPLGAEVAVGDGRLQLVRPPWGGGR